jgi:hypothetical protein
VTFAIYRDQYEGTPLWMETQNVQADAKGTYTAQLGATGSDGLPLELFSSGEARWLGVTVNGGQEHPRVLLLSVPYALKAVDAETIGGLPPSAFVRANGAQGTGTSAKTAPAVAPAGAKNAGPLNPAVTGAGVANFIPLWDTSSDIVDSVIFQKSSQIGINTTAPAATLDVNGKGDVRDTLTLFPKGTDPTLAVNGTTFKVDQTGKVTFISGQKFPGAGTVTSVGLSAPSSDFKVTGSPVTKSGTLGLSWTVAPTSSDTANAIVKRDGAGGFSAGGISALGLSATGTANVISAQMTGNTAQTAAVTGVATATGVGNTYGVAGYSATGNGVGVFGQNTSGTGVYAIGGTGVFGTSGTGGPGFATDTNVQQARTAGGWVKAMVFASGDSGNVVYCFNSTLSGTAATTPPCGFVMSKPGTGDYIIDFGFQVDDRFFAATQTGTSWTIAVCTDSIGVGCNNSLSANQVEVTSYDDINFIYRDTKFYLVVY